MQSKNINPTVPVDGNNIAGEPAITTPDMGGKIFSQVDVNRIVQERLARSKAELASKEQLLAAELAAKEQMLESERFELQAREILRQKGLTGDLLTAIKATNIDEFNAALAILDLEFSFSNPNQAYIQKQDGTWEKVGKNSPYDLPPCGNIPEPSEDWKLRQVMGLGHGKE